MIILDLNQVMIANLMAQLGGHSIEVNENLLRHMILNSIRMNRVKFKNEFGDLIIACDDKNNWRRQIFPYYKASRRKNRQESKLDWNSIFESLNKVRDELKEFFPYPTIQVDTAEADDIIAALCKKFGKDLGGEPILILSGDKDFVQLQCYSNVKQYDPVRKRWLSNSDPYSFLFEHIIKGDVGDGVPNFLSADDVFVSGSRQKPVSNKKMKNWISDLLIKDPSDVFEGEELRNFYRNKSLIDLKEVPEEISDSVYVQLENQASKDRSQLFNYFIKHKLKNLTENLNEF